jgi:para-nitrobenzyl esterase
MGSGHELAAFDGANLALRGDVVVVTLNHRLNVLGFLNLEAHGEAFAGSANASMLDLILALRWVRDNIQAFGGDPGLVTIFGQSGGGAKVTTLMAMPAAKGLFHRAIVQSNCALRQMPIDLSLRLTHEVLTRLGLTAPDVARLREVPYPALAEAERAAVAALCPPPNPARRNRRVRWEPVVDGVHLPAHAFDRAAPEVSRDVPLLVGTTLNEFHHGIGTDLPALMSFSDASASVAASFGDQGRFILDLFRTNHPSECAFDCLSRIYGATIRQSAVAQAEIKTAQRAGSTWLYRFDWQTPVLDGRPRAYHNAELPFVFHNAERCATATGGGRTARHLADAVADAWIAFARTGNPSHAGLPAWPAFTAERCETMLFDTVCRLDAGGDREERAAVGEA